MKLWDDMTAKDLVLNARPEISRFRARMIRDCNRLEAILDALEKEARPDARISKVLIAAFDKFAKKGWSCAPGITESVQMAALAIEPDEEDEPQPPSKKLKQLTFV